MFVLDIDTRETEKQITGYTMTMNTKILFITFVPCWNNRIKKKYVTALTIVMCNMTCDISRWLYSDEKPVGSQGLAITVQDDTQQQVIRAAILQQHAIDLVPYKDMKHS
jgi:hypothetical protein